MWAFNYFVKEPEKSPVNAQTTHNTKNSWKDGNLKSYCTTVNHLLKTYATDEIIDSVNKKLYRFAQTDRMMEAEYGEALYKKYVRCGSV